MKYIIMTFLALIAFPLTAKAQLTETLIEQFNTQYSEAFATCDDAKVQSFIDTHYDEDYTMLLQTPNGQTRQASKDQLKLIASQGIQMMVKVNGPEGNCEPDLTYDKSEINGATGILQTTQKEELTLPKDGKMVGIRANTTCQHQITEENGTLMILKSQCVLYQK